MLVDIGFNVTLESNPEHFRQALAADVALYRQSARSEDRLNTERA
jgi:hypothetical protein